MSVESSTSLTLDFLSKLIPEKFDGDRYKLRSFIKQVDAVFELAQPEQITPLLLFVKSKIIGKAREQIDIHCNLTSWNEISELLLNLYQDKKSFDQLLEELNNLRQGHNETVSQYYQRLEDVSSRVLANVHANESDKTLLKGRLIMVNDMTLNRFVYHSHPQISQMLRYRNFKNINEALSAALSEEKALRLNYNKHPRVPNYSINSRHPSANNPSNRNNSHSTNYNQFKFNQKNSSRSVHFNQPQDSKVPLKQCRYCKKVGHSIEECRKREYNNAKKSYSQPSNNNHKNINLQTANFSADGLQSDPPPIHYEEMTREFANLNL